MGRYLEERDRPCARHDINLNFINVVDHKGTAFVESFNRMLRILLEKQKTNSETNVWLPTLPELVENYNNRSHRILRISPMQALALGKRAPEDMKHLARRYTRAENQVLQSQHLSVGDVVRVLIRKNALTDKALLLASLLQNIGFSPRLKACSQSQAAVRRSSNANC